MTARERIEAFCLKHKLIFEERGEAGFGRPCVGLLSKGGNYLDYSPRKMAGNFDLIEELHDDRLRAPQGVDSYHKSDCFAVLITDDDYSGAIQQLATWIEHLESLGELEVVQYETDATGLQVMMSGLVGYALKVKEAAHGTNGDGEEEKAKSQGADSSEEEAITREAGAREEADSR